ncbi:SusC/RagA family TonB-linked outer membrane protein [Reichenbachiella ulvae]|uniref:SusC/RagA family TonB-linked outer membrane protein n=1 Tax=Reichenbachiella ulvae TaxID=2980104 RepID=A0ABT3CZP8_9BACT|nr:SusC/RagA family TonB-linked outer membrane protein [Reichenbachiella ulvae]MCV9389033.1 SusC/RagA family TonB-linked outer membrane protein [Reichenbachiella ulvae]
MKRILLICFMLLSALVTESWAQDRTVSGKVTDDSGEAIPGANVILKGTRTGTTSDIDGNWKLSVPSEGGVLVFTFVGMAPSEVEIGSRSVIDVAMATDAKQLSEVVVTSMGIAKENKTIGYAVSTVDGDEFTKSRSANIANGLAGKVAGVQVTASGGSVGASSRVVIRGASSINSNNQPLYVVDGIPISNTNVASVDRFTGPDYGNRIQDINPDDVETMTVLKGAAATALYGQRAANGAIIITTKSGSKNSKVSVTINSSLRFDDPLKLPDFQNTFGQGNLNKIDSSATSNWGPRMAGQTFTNANGYEDVYSAQPNNVKDFYETGQTMINNVAIAGGDENSTYRLSFTQFNQEGFVPNTNLDRYTISLKGSRKFDNNFYSEYGATYIMTRNEGRPITGFNDDGAISSVINFLPRNYNLDSLKNYKNPDGSPRLFLGLNQNPYWSLQENLYTGNIDRFISFGKIGWKPTDWIDVSWRGGADIYTERRLQRTAVGSVSKPEGEFWRDDLFESQLNSDFFITVNRNIGEDFNVNLLLGNNIFQRYLESSFNRGQGLTDPLLYIGDNALVNSVQNAVLDQTRIVGVFFDLGLSYKDWAFVNVTGRNDWNSTLPEENNSFFYPSVSASVILTDALNIDSNILSFAKLRGSWGQVGNGTDPFVLDFSYFPQTDIFQLFGVDNTYPWNGIPGYAGSGTIPPQDLKPELTTSWEIGTELQLFNGKLIVDATYYSNRTEDQIVRLSIPPSTGYLAQRLNAGTVENKGVELMLQAPLDFGKFNWTITGTFAKNNNELVELPENFEFLDIEGTRTDPSLRAYLNESLGVIIGSGWRRDDEGNILINPANGLRYDVNEQKIGNITPDFTAGLMNSFSYQGINLSILFDWRQGGDIHSQTVQQLRAGGHVKETEIRDVSYIDQGVVLVSEDADGNVIETRPNDIPITAEQFWGQQNDVDEDGVFDGTFVKLREVRLSYSLPRTLLDKTPFGEVEFGVEGRNLAIIYSKVPHIDPEVSFYGPTNAQGLEAYNLPTTRSYGFNIKLTF